MKKTIYSHVHSDLYDYNMLFYIYNIDSTQRSGGGNWRWEFVNLRTSKCSRDREENNTFMGCVAILVNIFPIKCPQILENRELDHALGKWPCTYLSDQILAQCRCFSQLFTNVLICHIRRVPRGNVTWKCTGSRNIPHLPAKFMIYIEKINGQV